MNKIIIFSLLAAIAVPSYAKVDLVTLPDRDFTQLTIYNSADLTLVRDMRNLTLKQGDNKLQFSWANTLIDPTSLSMQPKANAGDIFVSDLTFPPRVKNLGLWNIDSSISGKTPIEITYLTSGLSWRAFYMGTLAQDEKTMRLQGYVRVTNNSGEDYENAQTRLIVGKVHIIDQIAKLAGRNEPYGRPGQAAPREVRLSRGRGVIKEEILSLNVMLPTEHASGVQKKEIVKEGLSEYFLYTIEGSETIANQWSKRLPSFDTEDIPVVNLYKHTGNAHQARNRAVVRYLSFKNDTEHELGDTPIPGGAMKVYRGVDSDGHLSYEGQSSFKYIPVNEDVELNMGQVSNVIVKPTLMNYETDNYRFDTDGNIDGWDEISTIRIEIKNTRNVPVKIELKRNMNTTSWDIENKDDASKYYEVIDMNTVKYTVELEARTEKTIEYDLTAYRGTRADYWTNKQRRK